jgi:hypothetical protein
MAEVAGRMEALDELTSKSSEASGRGTKWKGLGFGNERDTEPPDSLVLPTMGRRILVGPGPTQMRPGGTRVGQGISPFAEGLPSSRLVPTID